nr:hypothetical protein [Tanacetum cinerariifolium]
MKFVLPRDCCTITHLLIHRKNLFLKILMLNLNLSLHLLSSLRIVTLSWKNDLTFTLDEPMPPGIEDDDDDSERDMLILEELLDNYSFSLYVIESYHFDIPSFSRPPSKPPDGNTGILNIKIMGDNSEQKVPIPRLTITHVSNQENSPDLLSHRDLENFQLSAKCPLMIHGKNIPILDDPNENSSQSPPHIDHHCCYGCGNSLDGIFCQRCTYDSPNPPPQPLTYSYEFCRNDAHYSHDCPPQVSFIYNPEPIHGELAEYINTSIWNHCAFYNYNDDDDMCYTIAITPVLSTKEPVDSLIMEDENLDTISAMEMDEVIKYSIEDLVSIPSEFEGIPDSMCDVPFRDNYPPLYISKYQFEDFFDSNDDSTSIDDYYFSIDDIDYVEASPPNSEPVNLEEVKDEILREKLLNIHLLIAKIESLIDNPTPDRVLKSPSLFPIPTFSNHMEETSSGSTTTHTDNSLLEYDLLLFKIKPDQGNFN